MNVNKFLVLTLASVLSLGLLASCATDTTTSPEAPEGETEELISPPDAPAEEETTDEGLKQEEKTDEVTPEEGAEDTQE